MTEAKVRRAAVGFTGTQVLGLRLTDEQLSELRAALQGGGSAGTRSRQWTAPCSSTSSRSSTCASSPTSTASGSDRRRPAPPAGRGQAPRPGDLPPCAPVRPHPGDRSARARASRGWVSTRSAGSRSAPLGATFDPHRRGRWLRATAAVGIAYLISTSIKLAIGRRRPLVEDLPHLMATPTGLSFPSSHSTSSFAAARAFSALLPRRPAVRRRARRWRSRGVSLGVHYPSDIAAGRGARHRPGERGRR